MLIKIENLKKSYSLGKTEIPVIHGIDLNIKKMSMWQSWGGLPVPANPLS